MLLLEKLVVFFIKNKDVFDTLVIIASAFYISSLFFFISQAMSQAMTIVFKKIMGIIPEPFVRWNIKGKGRREVNTTMEDYNAPQEKLKVDPAEVNGGVNNAGAANTTPTSTPTPIFASTPPGLIR